MESTFGPVGTKSAYEKMVFAMPSVQIMEGRVRYHEAYIGDFVAVYCVGACVLYQFDKCDVQGPVGYGGVLQREKFVGDN